ncbi:MAG: nucleotidyltransferase family protein [Prevotellaceae bacterium]|nr:nucleotidyltransferase family protein [Prevotellaceae bacterium]
MNQLFFELIRVVIGIQDTLSRTPSAQEWKQLYDMAKKQSLVGICFAAVQRLPEDMRPPEMLYLTWMGMAAKIQQRNEVVNKQCVELQKRLSADGFKSFLMKGQCNASLYGDLAFLRQSGDIDVYVASGRECILEYVQKTAPTSVINEIELEYKVFDDTEVDLHYKLPNFRNPFRNGKLHAFLCGLIDVNYDNKRVLPGGPVISCPVWEYDIVFQLVHIYDHFICRGVGLRQIMDFHFLLLNKPKDADMMTVKDAVKSIGLDGFASGLMWVLQHVFCLSMISVPWCPNKRDGEFLLKEILISGNFGHGNEKMNDVVTNTWKRAWVVNANTFRYWRFDHWAWFWSPLWRIYHFVWKKIKGYTK